MIRRSLETHKPFLALATALIVLAWLELTLWSLSPYAKYLNHEILGHLPVSVSPQYLALLTVFLFGWVLMTVAMMLPTSLPLVTLFYRLTQRRSDQVLLMSLLIAGYLSVWTLFGMLAHVGDLLVHEVVHRAPWLEANPWVISAGTLFLAGVYQFTSLKYACLDTCRSPLSFVVEHWRGRRQGLQALWLGVRHGAFCVGCCWSLMLLMFAFGCGNVAWMLGLGAVMAAEKNLPWGRKLSAPLGFTLLSASLAMVAVRLLVL